MLNGAGARYLADEEVEKFITVEAGVAGEIYKNAGFTRAARLAQARVNRSRLGKYYRG